jgi:hypothetical protein
MLAGTTPDRYLNFGNIIEKFGQANGSSVDNTANGVQSVAQMAVPGGGGFDFSNVAGFLSNFVSSGKSAGGLFSIPISGLSEMLTNAGLAATVNVSMAADQLGFSYADQIVALSGAAPYFDLVVAQMQLSDPADLENMGNRVNNFLGSA